MLATRVMQNRLPLLACLLLMLAAIESAQAQSTEALREEVLEAWQRRQHEVQSATFRIRSTVVLKENELRRIKQRSQTLHAAEPLPERDKTLVETYEVAFDGDKLRFSMSFDKSTSELAKAAHRNLSFLCVSNGIDYRTLESFPNHGQKSGVIQNADQFMAFRSGEVAPILQAFRALSPQRQPSTNDLKIVAGKHVLDGRPAVVLQQHFGDASSGGVQYWTDPARDFVVQRKLTLAGDNQVVSQDDIQYEQDQCGNWVPVKWNMVTFASAGKLRRTAEFQVVDYEINPRLPSSLFELEFAPGIQVVDKREGAGKLKVWTVNQDGTKTMQRGAAPDQEEATNP